VGRLTETIVLAELCHTFANGDRFSFTERDPLGHAFVVSSSPLVESSEPRLKLLAELTANGGEGPLYR